MAGAKRVGLRINADARAVQRERASAAPRRLSVTLGSSGTGRRAGVGAERRRQAGSGERSQRRRERGKATGVASGEPATGSDPGNGCARTTNPPAVTASADGARQHGDGVVKRCETAWSKAIGEDRRMPAPRATRRTTKAVSVRNEWPEPRSKRNTGAVAAPARAIQAGLGRRRGVAGCPRKNGRARRRLERGERPFPAYAFKLIYSFMLISPS